MPKSAATPASRVWSFTLVLDGVSELTDEMMDALYETGCDDALVGSRDGVSFLDFDREAGSFEEAVMSAMQSVQSANIKARVIRIEPDELVTMAEIARRTKRGYDFCGSHKYGCVTMTDSNYYVHTAGDNSRGGPRSD